MSSDAGRKFLGYEKDLDELHQIFIIFENYKGDDKIKYDVLNKVLQNNDIQSENDIAF